MSPASSRTALPPAPGWVEAVGRVSYRLRQHLQVALLVIALLVARPLGSPSAERLLLFLSLLLVVAGGGLRSWAMGYHTWRRVKGEASKRTLVTAGPYAHTRNPLYLGSFLTGCGVAAMSGWLALLLAFAAVFIATHFCIIRWEEGKLDAEFEHAFRRYATEVPRLFPGTRSAIHRTGRFDLPTMMRCMEPVKTAGFVIVIVAMEVLKTYGWTLAS